MNERICTGCQTTFDPRPETVGIWSTFILGFFFLWPLWIITVVLVKRRHRCTACGNWKTLDLTTSPGQTYAKRFAQPTKP